MLVWASILGGIAILHAVGLLIPQESEPEPIRVRVRD